MVSALGEEPVVSAPGWLACGQLDHLGADVAVWNARKGQRQARGRKARASRQRESKFAAVRGGLGLGGMAQADAPVDSRMVAWLVFWDGEDLHLSGCWPKTRGV